jgi:hypothetical protein
MTLKESNSKGLAVAPQHAAARQSLERHSHSALSFPDDTTGVLAMIQN